MTDINEALGIRPHQPTTTSKTCGIKENHNHNGKEPSRGIGVAWFLIAVGLSCVICGILWKSSAAKEEASLRSLANDEREKAFQFATESIRAQYFKYAREYSEASMSKQRTQNYAIGLLFLGTILACCGGWKLSSAILGMKSEANQKGPEKYYNRQIPKNTPKQKKIIYDNETHQYVVR